MVELEAWLSGERDLEKEAVLATALWTHDHQVANANIPLVHPRKYQVLTESAGPEAKGGAGELGLPGRIVRATVCRERQLQDHG